MSLKFQHLCKVMSIFWFLNYSGSKLALFLLQIVLSKDQTPEDGQKVVESIMELLQIGKADLIDCAYLDLLNRSTTV